MNTILNTPAMAYDYLLNDQSTTRPSTIPAIFERVRLSTSRLEPLQITMRDDHTADLTDMKLNVNPQCALGRSLHTLANQVVSNLHINIESEALNHASPPVKSTTLNHQTPSAIDTQLMNRSPTLGFLRKATNTLKSQDTLTFQVIAEEQSNTLSGNHHRVTTSNDRCRENT
jgi:hypothetical protein